ncbi:MAG: 2,4-dihydroxyhept-2-ene-1,7-dioic acid aldolase, partial [Herbaspirillum sp.]|nr:2,4-dihydroxyhept-2-ene-1,7-dioic acid aldolase [Herbaspirillum sp.]
MRPNDLRTKWENGLPLVNAWLSIPSAYAAEV